MAKLESIVFKAPRSLYAIFSKNTDSSISRVWILDGYPYSVHSACMNRTLPLALIARHIGSSNRLNT